VLRTEGQGSCSLLCCPLESSRVLPPRALLLGLRRQWCQSTRLLGSTCPRESLAVIWGRWNRPRGATRRERCQSFAASSQHCQSLFLSEFASAMQGALPFDHLATPRLSLVCVEEASHRHCLPVKSLSGRPHPMLADVLLGARAFPCAWAGCCLHSWASPLISLPSFCCVLLTG